MTEQQENTLIRRALMDAAAQDFEQELTNPPPARLSRRQTRRMKAMLADPTGYYRRVTRPVWKKVMHTAAMFAVTVGLSATVLSSLSPDVHAMMKAWFKSIRQSDIVYYFTGEAGSETLPRYIIADLPEGYQQSGDTVELTGYYSICYKNDDGLPLYFIYSEMAQGSALGVETENMEVSDITVNGCDGQLFLSLDPAVSNAIVWMDEDANIQFVIDAYEDDSVLLHMAKSVYLLKT